MPCNYSEYPSNWKWISKQTIKDAGNKCELCYAPNGEKIFRFKEDKYPWRLASEADLSTLKEMKLKIIKVVLTVHHIDGDKENTSKQNLIALCQKDHLRLDLAKHMMNRTKTKALPIFF